MDAKATKRLKRANRYVMMWLAHIVLACGRSARRPRSLCECGWNFGYKSTVIFNVHEVRDVAPHDRNVVVDMICLARWTRLILVVCHLTFFVSMDILLTFVCREQIGKHAEFRELDIDMLLEPERMENKKVRR